VPTCPLPGDATAWVCYMLWMNAWS